MFGRAARHQKQIETLHARIRHLESLVQALADRAGVTGAELEELRGGAGALAPEECRRLVAEGKVIEAIKVYRERTGAGLKDAKDAIDRHREGVA